MKVNHLQAVYDTLFPQYLHKLQGLAGGQAELGRLATRFHPATGAAGKELDSHAHPGSDAHLLGILQNIKDLLEEVDNYYYIIYIMDAQSQAQIILVLVAVADEERLFGQAQG